MKKHITEETRHAILEAAWALMSARGGLNAGQAEIAAAAGVSRQTVFYAFGNRAGLLVAMVRHRDHLGSHVSRLREIAAGPGSDKATLAAYLDVWLSYLPEVYPVAIQLEAAALTDMDAALAWNDRFYKGLRRGFELILGRMAAQRQLAPGKSPAQVADLLLSLVVPSAWRLLVVEGGWTPQAFAASRHMLMGAALTDRESRVD